MRLRRILCVLAFASAASAQQRPIFDPDDFVDPRLHERPIFISRLVVGAARNYIDDLRPAHQDAAFVHVANSLYWWSFQFDYKHSEVRGENGDPPLRRCDCQPPLFFPTPPPENATPDAPTPGAKDSLQFAWYGRSPGGAMLRVRGSWSRQTIDETIISTTTGAESHLSGREQSFGLETDTHLRLAGRDVWGALLINRNERTGTHDNRSQTELLYTSRVPGWSIRGVLVRPTLTVGGVSGRGASGLNVVSPAFEAFWHEPRTRANVHLVWNPQVTRDGANGWAARHQIAIFVDRYLVIVPRR